MKRFTGIEKAGLLLAAVLILGGASLAIWPESGMIPHPSGRRAAGFFQKITPVTSRIIGAIAIAFGAGLAASTVYRSKP